MTEAKKMAKHRWEEKNPDKVRMIASRANATYYARNREKIRAKYQQTKHLRDDIYKERSREAGLKKRFGISPEQYNTKLDSQDHCCVICGAPDGNGYSHRTKRLAQDHCHKTGKLRGLLCNGCNTGLGSFKDRPEILREAAKYLERYQ